MGNSTVEPLGFKNKQVTDTIVKWRARGTKNFLASSTMRKEKMIVTPSAKLEEEEEEEGEEEISMLNIRMSRTPIEDSPVPIEPESVHHRS